MSRLQQRDKDGFAQRARFGDADTIDEGDYDDTWPPRMPNSTRRYQADVRTEMRRPEADVQALSTPRTSRADYAGPRTSVPPRRTATQTNIPAVQVNRRSGMHTDEITIRSGSKLVGVRPRRRFHWLVFVGLVMLVMVMGWVVLNVLTNWWQITLDDWHYGRPRTFQTDAVVGHNDSAANPSHFIALNLNRHIEIIEFPGGDASKAKIYVGPTLIGQGQDLAVVTLSFKDVNGDGKPDMIVSVQGSRFVFINDNGAFRPVRPGENVQI